jgi:RNA polymerase sigma factor (sigma-70 family)
MDNNLQNKIEQFENKYERYLNEPIIKDFLKIPEHRSLLIEIINTENVDKRILLDQKFKVFYKRARIVKYIDSLIHFYSIDFDKKIRKVKNRFPLILDTQENGSSDVTSLLEVIPSSIPEPLDIVTNEKAASLKEIVENENLYSALEKLTDKQLSVLELIYVKNLSNKEVANFFNESPQNISKVHKQTIKKLRVLLMEK